MKHTQKYLSGRNIEEIVAEMRRLLDELLIKVPLQAKRGGIGADTGSSRRYSGPSGGIKLLLQEGFFKDPKAVPEVVAKLREQGFNYPRSTIAVALLRMVRDRTLVRIKAEKPKGKEKWVYAERK